MITNFVLQSSAQYPVRLELETLPLSGSYVGCYSSVPYTLYLSAEDVNPHSVHLYAEGSNSEPYQQPQNKWSHLIPQWRFTDLFGNYIQTIIPTNSALISSGNIFIGMSATAQFYYIDDMVVDPVTIWAIVDYSDYPVHLDARTKLSAVPGFSNSMVLASTVHTVSGLDAERILITRNGKDPLFPYYWLNTNIPLYFTIHGSANIVSAISASIDPILFNYPAGGEITRGVSGIDFSLQTWSPSTEGIILSSTDDDGFVIGGYFSSTVLLSTESLQTIVTAGSSTDPTVLSGASSIFGVLAFDDWNIRRFNESWDATREMNALAFSPHIKDNTTFWEDYVSGVFGSIEAEHGKSFGRQAYERVANYVKNHADVEVCGVSQLYSLAEETDIPVDDYNFGYPQELQRIMDVVSINQQKLWGARCTCTENIENEYKTMISGGQPIPIDKDCPKCGFAHPGNRGNLFDSLTYFVTAGTKFIVRDKYLNDRYSLLTPTASTNYNIVTADPCDTLQVGTTSLSTYALSASYWWLLPGVFTTTPTYDDFIDSAVSRYCFYSYVKSTCRNQVAGLINWDDGYTTLNENLSTADDWFGTNNAIEKMLSYTLHKGLGLING